jgi:hypothetical protein
MAKQFGLYLLSNNNDMHIFSKRKINHGFFKSLKIFNKIKNILDIQGFIKQKSKVWDDFQMLLGTNKSI